MGTSEECVQISEQSDLLGIMARGVAVSFCDFCEADPFANYDDVINVDLGPRSVDDLARNGLSWNKGPKDPLWNSVHDDIDVLRQVSAHFDWFRLQLLVTRLRARDTYIVAFLPR